MITIFESIFLGILQGITEFLPISSSGHLVLFQKILGIDAPPLFFDTVVHLGTLFAVIFYLRKEITQILKTLKEKNTKRILCFIFLATIPAVAVGLLFQDKIEAAFASLFFVGVSFIITSVILALTYFFKKGERELSTMNWFDALFIGVFQAVAILPGVSRSGSTISASLFRNLKKKDAFKFSFLMSIPVILGAFFLQFKQQNFELVNGDFFVILIGFMVAMVFGFISLKIVERVVINGKFYYFSFYCFLLGSFILIFAR